MFFATATPSTLRRAVYSPAGRSLERFLDDARRTTGNPPPSLQQDEQSFTLTFDVPGVAQDQLRLGIEGAIVRIESREGAPRQYKAAYELPQEIDASASDARLENGVLTVKLAKKMPVSNVTELNIH